MKLLRNLLLTVLSIVTVSVLLKWVGLTLNQENGCTTGSVVENQTKKTWYKKLNDNHETLSDVSSVGTNTAATAFDNTIAIKNQPSETDAASEFKEQSKGDLDIENKSAGSVDVAKASSGTVSDIAHNFESIAVDVSNNSNYRSSTGCIDTIETLSIKDARLILEVFMREGNNER